MKLIPSNLPVLDKEYSYLNRYDIYMIKNERSTAPPECYGPEPSPKDNREYPDWDPKKVRTINIPRGVGINTMAEAELYLHDHYRFSKLLAKQTCRDGSLFSFKVVGNDT